MQAQEVNAATAAGNLAPNSPTNDSCSAINQVSEKDCARFNMVNEIR